MKKTILIIGVIAGLLISFGTGIYLNARTMSQLMPTPTETAQSNLYALWQDTNQQRVNNNLQPLYLDAQLNQAATDRCNDMVSQNYYEHINPQGVTPRDVVSKYTNVQKTTYVGENIADGSYTAQSVIDAWMASPEHRDNILNTHVTNIGFSYCTRHDGSTFYVQDFLGQ